MKLQKMLQKETKIINADNTGVKLLKCINIKGNKKYGLIGNLLSIVVNKFRMKNMPKSMSFKDYIEVRGKGLNMEDYIQHSIYHFYIEKFINVLGLSSALSNARSKVLSVAINFVSYSLFCMM